MLSSRESTPTLVFIWSVIIDVSDQTAGQTHQPTDMKSFSLSQWEKWLIKVLQINISTLGFALAPAFVH